MVPPRRRSPAEMRRRARRSAVVAVLILLAPSSSAGAAPTYRQGPAIRTETGPLARTGLSATRPAPAVGAPVPTGIDVLRRFERPDHDWSAGHRGVDLATEVGNPVVSAVDGVVTFAGTVVDRGVVTVRDGRGRLSSVEPVAPVVRTGETVQKGQTIATVMDGHCSDRPCLHWGVRVGGVYVDPLGLLRPPARIVLLPIPEGSGHR